VITGAAQGIPVKVVSGGAKSAEVDGKTSYAVIAKDDPSIRRFKDLEGKTVGVNSLQGNWEVTLRESIERDGGDPSKVELVQIPFAEQGAALRQGRVDAISTFQPFATAIEGEGDYQNLGDPQAAALADPEAASTVTYMPTKFINEHPDAVKGYVAAITEAAEIANKDPELVRELTTKHTQIPAKLVDAAPVPSFTTAMSPEMVDRWTELLVKYGVIPSPVDSSTVLWEGTPTS
jgi:NitT/TauT family transport system substrate-binding protein